MIYCVLSPPNPRYLEGPVVPMYHSVPQPQVFDIKLSPNDFVFLNISAPGVFKYNPTDAFLNIFISCVREREREREREGESDRDDAKDNIFVSAVSHYLSARRAGEAGHCDPLVSTNTVSGHWPHSGLAWHVECKYYN